ncbi:hypothetical protein AMATHDRAFT_45563 [Amanita thiersii Skay4041]|uniref:Yeast cell wall synthesis Kre9/Knh1-like N-terminal domain-containing protein n=1 Tax=Amanita thiersii Skay4041 TaxID=703135 RepID=A0A2A9NXX2_9AGAR|nr:hypothetical protein AMATHDRAFT_45563 [Amanita thiersii Skay4041]
MLFTLLATLFFALLASAAPFNNNAMKPHTRIVFSPQITNPKSNVTWLTGSTHNVTWDTTKIPEEKRNLTGLILLGHAGNNSENLDIEHPLATNFPIKDGTVAVTIPMNKEPRDDYFVVLFGDSGNTSEKFKLVKPASRVH